MKKALVITGRQGSGKTLRARVEAYGRYVETNYQQISEPFGLSVVMSDNPDTVIVDDMPSDYVEWIKAKALITSEKILINEKYKSPRFVKTPHFIFCTSSEIPLPAVVNDRRFQIVSL